MVDNFDHALQAVKQGLGYCRIPKNMIESHEGQGLVILKVEHSNCYQVPLHLTLPKAEKTGSAAKYLYLSFIGINK